MWQARRRALRPVEESSGSEGPVPTSFERELKVEDLPPNVRRAAELALERKGRDVVALDLQGLSSATDHFVVASGTSDVQVKAIAEHIIDTLRDEGLRPKHVEGLRTARWVLVDYFDFIVHVFHAEARAFYGLEQLWGDAAVAAFHEG